MSTRYRVVAGQHNESDPAVNSTDPFFPKKTTKFNTGDIIESERPLDEIFPNKFEKVVEGGGPVVITDARREAVTKMIQGGTWAEEDRKFLEELSNDGFERVFKRNQMTERKRTTTVLGEDVTDLFQRAYDEGFKVFRNPAGKHQVTKGTASTKPLNKEPLEQADVDKFVDETLKKK